MCTDALYICICKMSHLSGFLKSFASQPARPPAQEWQHVRYKYQCLPVEQVLVHGEPTTVYAVLPPPVGQPEEEDNEWMYRMAEHSGARLPVPPPSSAGSVKSRADIFTPFCFGATHHFCKTTHQSLSASHWSHDR